MTRLALRTSLFLAAVSVVALGRDARRAAERLRRRRRISTPCSGGGTSRSRAPSGPYPSWVQVQLRKETELQGRFVGQFGSVRNITKIGYGDGTLAFDVPVQYETNKSDLHFVGKLVGDTLDGTTLGPDGAPLTWTGVRAPAFGPDK